MILPNGSPESKIMIVGGYPAADDYRAGKAFSGSSGWELDKMLREAGISRQECFVTTLFKNKAQSYDEIAYKKDQISPLHSELKGKWVKPNVRFSYDLLMTEIEAVNPSIIIALGDLPLWALTEKWGIKKWRGSQLLTETGRKVLPTYRPQDVFSTWEIRPIVVQDLRSAHYYTERSFPKQSWNVQIQPTFEQVMSILSSLLARVRQEPTKIAYDIETLAVNISCLGLAWNKLEAICIPFMKMGKPEGYFGEEEEVEIVFTLYQIMTNPNFQGITQNGLFDSQYLYANWHFMPRHYQDTMISHHTLFPTMQKSLDFICSFHNEQYVYWKDDLKEWRTAIVADEIQYWNYNGEDCVRTYEAADNLQVVVDEMGQRKQHDFQQALFLPVHKMMNRGVRIDTMQQTLLNKELKAEAARIIKDIEYVVGYPLNPRSSLQMQKFFYGEMAQPKQTKRTKEGVSISCDSSSLEKVAQKEPLLKPLIDMIEEWRSVQVFITTFLADKRGKDGRMHCSYNIGGTYTFRFSSSSDAFGSGMNLQNVPKGDD
jgi:uracil-DNA glycosylase